MYADLDRIYLFFQNSFFHKVKFNDKDIRFLLGISKPFSGVMEYVLEEYLKKGENNFVNLFFNYEVLKENIDITSIFRFNTIHLLKRMYSEGVSWSTIEPFIMETDFKLSPEITDFLEEYMDAWEEGSFYNNEIKPVRKMK